MTHTPRRPTVIWKGGGVEPWGGVGGEGLKGGGGREAGRDKLFLGNCVTERKATPPAI